MTIASAIRRRAMAHTAAPSPWGRERRISKASDRGTISVPRRRARSASTLASGQADRLARVRFFTFPPFR